MTRSHVETGPLTRKLFHTETPKSLVSKQYTMIETDIGLRIEQTCAPKFLPTPVKPTFTELAFNRTGIPYPTCALNRHSWHSPFHPTGIAAMHRTGIAYRPRQCYCIKPNRLCRHSWQWPSTEPSFHRIVFASNWELCHCIQMAYIVQLEFRQTGNLSNWHSMAFHRTAIPAHASCIVRRSRLTSLSGPRPRHLRM